MPMMARRPVALSWQKTTCSCWESEAVAVEGDDDGAVVEGDVLDAPGHSVFPTEAPRSD
jgi:hypothetical protein